MTFDAKELKEKYNPDGSTTYRMQQRMLDLLKVFDDICRKHNITYWLSGGSMLGAVRHQGFIPWDDDLDVELLRPDYERLMHLLPSELPDNMALQWHTTDKNYFFQYAKLRDRNSCIYELNGYDRTWKEHGVWIDIFPLERTPLWIHKLSVHTLGHCYTVLRKSTDDNKAMRKVRVMAALNRGIIYPTFRLLTKLLPCKYYDFALGIPYYQHSLREDFTPVRYVKFEDTEAPIMKEAEKCLTYRYGDYMQLPKNPGSQCHSDNIKIW